MRTKSTLIIVLIIIAVLVAIGGQFAGNAKEELVVITVTDKERITERSSNNSTDSKYLVYTDGETFENTDNLIQSKWNSSDLQGMLRKDSTYTVRVIGIRIPAMSMYRNIIEIIKE